VARLNWQIFKRPLNAQRYDLPTVGDDGRTGHEAAGV
jgi:hypothetical protein